MKCHIYIQLYFQGNIRVINHCHIIGEYNSSAHQICNANYRLTQKIPVIFHDFEDHKMQKIGQFDQKG